MRHFMRLLGGGAPALVALVAALAACGNPASPRTDALVGVKVAASTPAIANGVLRLTHWAYDPNSADGPATLVGADSVRFAHVAGVEDFFILHVNGRVPGGMKHYIAIRGFDITPDCVKYVLWDGISDIGVIPSGVTMQPVTPACERTIPVGPMGTLSTAARRR